MMHNTSQQGTRNKGWGGWKIQEILYSMGNEIFLFGLKEAEKNVFKEGWGQN